MVYWTNSNNVSTIPEKISDLNDIFNPISPFVPKRLISFNNIMMIL